MADVIAENRSERLVSFQLPWKPDGRRKVNKAPDPIDVPPMTWRRISEAEAKQIEAALASAQRGGGFSVREARDSDEGEYGSLSVIG